MIGTFDALHRLNELPPDHPRRSWFDAAGTPPLRVECSLAFFNDKHRRLLDPAAPSVESRMEALRFLRKEGLPVFCGSTRCSLATPWAAARRWRISGCRMFSRCTTWKAWSIFSRDLGSQHIIYSVAKITRRKQGDLPPVMEKMKRVYQHLSAGQLLVFHGGSWRLPESVVAELVLRPFLELCSRHSIPAKPCKTNLITTP